MSARGFSIAVVGMVRRLRSGIQRVLKSIFCLSYEKSAETVETIRL